jgi:hypothetical protein
MESLGLYLVQPGTADVNMGILNAASVGRDGTFSQAAPLWEHGCEAATLDSQTERPTGSLLIAARSGEAPVGPGERIADIIAVARYTYTTATPHVPTETLRISPTGGPCNGTVETRGSGFEPGLEVLLKLGRPGSDDTLGTVASATADGAGGFVVQFNLGDVGCQAAQLNITAGDPAQPHIRIGAFRAVYATPPQGIPPVLAGVAYTYTTTAVSPAPRAVPSSGNGPEERSTFPVWLTFGAGLAAAGLALMIASLYRRGPRS